MACGYIRNEGKRHSENLRVVRRERVAKRVKLNIQVKRTIQIIGSANKLLLYIQACAVLSKATITENLN